MHRITLFAIILFFAIAPAFYSEPPEIIRKAEFLLGTAITDPEDRVFMIYLRNLSDIEIAIVTRSLSKEYGLKNFIVHP